MSGETDNIKELVDKMVDHALERGFYAGQAMAGVELERAHENWARYNLPDEEKAKIKTAEIERFNREGTKLC